MGISGNSELQGFPVYISDKLMGMSWSDLKNKINKINEY